MTLSVIVHLANEDPIMGEVVELPDQLSSVIIISHPRLKDGKELRHLEEDVQTILIPWHRINFIEVMPSTAAEEVVTFVRE